MITGTLNIDWAQAWTSALGLAQGYETLLLILATVAFFPIVVGIAIWILRKARGFAPK